MAFRKFTRVAARLLHTTNKMLEASGGRFQSHADVNSDALLKIVAGSDAAPISRIMVT